MTWYLDSTGERRQSGDVYHNQTLIGNAGDSPFSLEEDITAVVVAESLPNPNASVRGEHLQTVVALSREDMEFGAPPE